MSRRTLRSIQEKRALAQIRVLEGTRQCGGGYGIHVGDGRTKKLLMHRRVNAYHRASIIAPRLQAAAAVDAMIEARPLKPPKATK